MTDCSTEATPLDDRKRLSKDMSPVTAAGKAEMGKFHTEKLWAHFYGYLRILDLIHLVLFCG